MAIILEIIVIVCACVLWYKFLLPYICGVIFETWAVWNFSNWKWKEDYKNDK